jgi:hypothetical protein
MLSRRLQLAIGLLLSGSAAAASYMPFAGVEELHMQDLGQFCDAEVKMGTRLCQGKTHRVLEDGGIVSLDWAMNTDPDRILSLDTEHKHGVRLVKCTPSSLELVLPASHERHVRVGELIVGSHFVHGCEHLMQVTDQEKVDDEPVNHNLYHRIVKVVKHEYRNADGSLAAGSSTGTVSHVKVWTKEMESLGHAIGSVAYQFAYTPVEAVDDVPFPERRTWDGDYYDGKWADDKHAAGFEGLSEDYTEIGARRLNQFDHRVESFNPATFSRPTDQYSAGTLVSPNHDIRYKVDSGRPLFGGSTVTTDDVKSLLHIQPKKVSNFGWNWNFKLNASQDISFNYTVPGNNMYVIIKKPYIKAHSEVFFKFRS